MALKILVADDEERIRRLLRDYLKREGYEVLEAPDGEAAINLFYETQDLSLIILDIMMPKMNGLEVLKEIRDSGENGNVPVILLTARTSERDQLAGFDSGADEYVEKPFSPRVLIARVNAILKRRKQEVPAKIEFSDLMMDTDAREVYSYGKQVELSYKEFELLKYFMENTGRALSREKILAAVWDYDFFGDERTVDTHVKKLRSKLGSAGEHIKTVWGMGYKFEA
ncbi:MAG: response regulator transcription factor [Lachnospiraceae bacterium]|nr:response regulator transcription factor [Lachnospiraceae bacterium]